VPLYFLVEALNTFSLAIIGGVIQAYIIDNADDMKIFHKIMGRVNRLSFFFMAVACCLELGSRIFMIECHGLSAGPAV